MNKTKKINGVIRVGLGQSPSGKFLQDSLYYNLSAKLSKDEQIKTLNEALKYHLETNKRMFYSHTKRKYIEINEAWIQSRIIELNKIETA